MIDWLFFVLAAAFTLGSAVQVLRTPDMVHVILWLAMTLLGTAALYVLLDAGFLAAIQVLLYTGGVITLMLFAVLLARRQGGFIPSGGHAGNVRAGLTVSGFFGIVVFAIFRGASLGPPGADVTLPALADTLLRDLALPFEVLSVLLLASMVGAIVLARRKDA